MYRYHSPLYSRAAAMGVSEAFSSKIIYEMLYSRVIDTRAHTCIYARVENARLGGIYNGA